MRKAISFDLWMTLIDGNPAFKREKYNLIRDFFELDYPDEHLANAFRRADKLLDRVQERYLIQPEKLTAWAIVLHEIGLAETRGDQIASFLEFYNQLFLEHPPLIFDDAQFLFEKLLAAENYQLFILSNTILVTGETLDKFLQTTILNNIPAFYSDSFYSKPDRRAFEMLPAKPFLHVGDNPITDGGAAQFDIEFYQVRTNGKTLIDFWQFLNSNVTSA